VLVRPDGFVAWREASLPSHPAASLGQNLRAPERPPAPASSAHIGLEVRTFAVGIARAPVVGGVLQGGAR
jgi:hypothetical protein